MPRKFHSPTLDQPMLFTDERGLSTVEYVIILVLIAAAALASWQLLGTTIMSKIHASDTAIRTMKGLEAGHATDESRNGDQPEGATSTSPAVRRAFAKTDD